MGASQRWAEVDQAFCVSQELSAVDSVDTYSILGLKAGETSDPKVPDNSGVSMRGGNTGYFCFPRYQQSLVILKSLRGNQTVHHV